MCVCICECMYVQLIIASHMLWTERAGGRQAHLTAEVVRGTCCDMCPEKERYMREDRRRLSVYEMVPGTDLVRS